MIYEIEWKASNSITHHKNAIMNANKKTRWYMLALSKYFLIILLESS